MVLFPTTTGSESFLLIELLTWCDFGLVGVAFSMVKARFLNELLVFSVAGFADDGAV